MSRGPWVGQCSQDELQGELVNLAGPEPRPAEPLSDPSAAGRGLAGPDPR